MFPYSKYDPPEVRFWAKVYKPSNPDDCWIWVAGKTGSGYGVLTINYKAILVHRFSYELHCGPIPEGRFVCHHCDVPACVNPAHLFLGTPKDNTHDMIAKGRAVHVTRPMPGGEDHPNARLTWKQIDEMRTLFATGTYSKAQLAMKYGVTKSNIGEILHWRTWRKDDSPPPEYPGKTKLAKDDVRTIRAEYASGNVFQRELADRFGVTPSLISQIVNRKRWAHID